MKVYGPYISRVPFPLTRKVKWSLNFIWMLGNTLESMEFYVSLSEWHGACGFFDIGGYRLTGT